MLCAGVPNSSQDVSALWGADNRKSSDLKKRNWTFFFLRIPNVSQYCLNLCPSLGEGDSYIYKQVTETFASLAEWKLRVRMACFKEVKM